MEFSNLGKHCEHPDCHLLDFLPFSCDACKSTFCLDHHKYADHSCKIGRTAKNVECKTCPHCSQVVPVQVTLTAEQSLAKHITKGCPQERKRGPRCVECQKSQLVPMHCSTCHESVCPKHRHPLDHHCGSKSAQIAKSDILPKRVSSPASVAAAAAAEKRISAPASPTLPTAPAPDTISFNVMLSSAIASRGASTVPCRVYAKKSWNVETAVRALCKNFNVSPEGLCLLMSGSDTAIAHDLPLDLIADEIQATTLVLDREKDIHRMLDHTNHSSRAVKAN